MRGHWHGTRPCGRDHAHGVHGPHRRRLFWRVYLHGLFLLFAVTAAVVVLGLALGRGSSTWGTALRFRDTLERGGPALLKDRAALQALLTAASERTNADISLYATDGRLLASNVDPALPPLPAERARRLGREPFQLESPEWVAVVPVQHGGMIIAYALADWRGPGAREVLRASAMLGAVLLALALASIPLVRTIVSPLERLTRAARALGSGDLTTRSGIARRRDEVGELASAFDEMAERLQRLVRTERELLANVSHELRTPLSRIRVALELAAEGDAARAQRYLGEIGADLAELEQLVEDVLTAARLDAQGTAGEALPLHPTDVIVTELLDEAARRFHSAWPDGTLVVEADSDLPVLRGDPMLLRRVVDNLLDNARKYSEPGRPVRVHAQREPGQIRIDVVDEGIGMGEADLKQLFTPFFRSDRSRQRGTGGVGLGLVLARRIIEAHGGALTATSAPGQGSTFTLQLPARPPQGQADGPRPS